MEFYENSKNGFTNQIKAIYAVKQFIQSCIEHETIGSVCYYLNQGGTKNGNNEYQALLFSLRINLKKGFPLEYAYNIVKMTLDGLEAGKGITYNFFTELDRPYKKPCLLIEAEDINAEDQILINCIADTMKMLNISLSSKLKDAGMFKPMYEA